MKTFCINKFYHSILLSLILSIQAPSEEKPFQGKVNFFLEGDELDDHEFKEFNGISEQIFKQVLDLESLCINSGVSVWSLRFDIKAFQKYIDYRPLTLAFFLLVSKTKLLYVDKVSELEFNLVKII